MHFESKGTSKGLQVGQIHHQHTLKELLFPIQGWFPKDMLRQQNQRELSWKEIDHWMKHFPVAAVIKKNVGSGSFQLILLFNNMH